MKRIIYIMSILLSLAIVVFLFTLRDNYQSEQIAFSYIEDAGESEITIPELNNGRAVLLELPTGEYILFDCGNSGDFPKIYEILRNKKIEFLDYVVFTSDSNECTGAIENILSNVKVGQICMSVNCRGTKRYSRICTEAERFGAKVTLCTEGSRIYEYGNAFVDVVSDNRCTLNGKIYNVLSIYVSHGDNALFIEGDCNNKAETEIVKTYGNAIGSDIYIVPNCGLDAASSEEIIKTISPFYAVVPIHSNLVPSDKVLDRLYLKDINVLRTDQCGTVKFISDGKNIKINRER